MRNHKGYFTKDTPAQRSRRVIKTHYLNLFGRRTANVFVGRVNFLSEATRWWVEVKNNQSALIKRKRTRVYFNCYGGL